MTHDEQSIKVYRINTPDELEESGLGELSRKVGHRIAPPYPVHGIWKDGQLKAAFHVRNHAVIYPALHLSKITPREFYMGCRYILDGFGRHHPDGLVVTDLEYPDGSITPEKLAKVGLVPFNHRVYRLKT